MRLFVAVELSELADPIQRVQTPLADIGGLRLTDPEQAHVTLQFLGETDDERLPELREAIDTAVAGCQVAPFELGLEEYGVFPSLEYITVVWLGVGSGEAELTALHERLERATTPLGFDPAEEAFVPHVTLARMDHAGGKDAVQELVREREPSAGTTTVRRVTLVQSTLTADGPVYEPLDRFALPGT